MTILSVIRDACLVIGLQRPDAVYASVDLGANELGALANDMASRIAKASDWKLLRKIVTYTGNGSTLSYAYPSDFDRMPDDAKVYGSGPGWELAYISDLDDWLSYEVKNEEFIHEAWTSYGGEIHFKPAIPTGQTAKHWYVSNLIVKQADNTLAPAFLHDDDVFRLDERLLTLGIIWQWRANKGLPYAEDMENYEDRKAKLITADGPKDTISIGQRRFNAQVAYPWPLGGS